MDVRQNGSTPGEGGRGDDSIVARATPAGRGGIHVIRVSGPRSSALAAAILGDCPPPRQAVYRPFRDERGEPIDSGLALFFPGPASYTGEDVLELHAHGSPVVAELLVERLVALGARPARPGEFTERAYLNDKLDLSQAEAVADLIDAGSRAAARAAHRALEGQFSSRIHALDQQLIHLRMHVEAALDFPDEDIDFLADEALAAGLDEAAASFDRLRRTAREGRLLRDGLTIVLAGRPNSGKSSLLNALAGYEAAIVTDIPGTTRDLVRERLEIGGVPVHLVDTAGLRDTDDPVEQEGVRRTRAQLGVADLALLVTDASRPDAMEAGLPSELPDDLPCLVLRNKIDLIGDPPGPAADAPDTLNLSALTGAGVDELRQAILERIGLPGFDSGSADTMTARQRHLDILARARRHFDSGRAALSSDGAGELLAEELRQAQNSLAEITGEFTADDLLGRIFSSFCIGK